MPKLFSLVAAIILLLIAINPVQAAPPPTTPALYRGRVIDLAKDWQGAQACAVLGRGEVRCYDSEAEQWRDLGRRPQQPTALLELDTYCLNRNDLYLVLYSDTNYGGTSVSFNAADVWHDLSGVSFDNVTSSWRNNTYCDATAATGTSGGGTTMTMAARSQNADVGSTWNDVISSVKILAS